MCLQGVLKCIKDVKTFLNSSYNISVCATRQSSFVSNHGQIFDKFYTSTVLFVHLACAFELELILGKSSCATLVLVLSVSSRQDDSIHS